MLKLFTPLWLKVTVMHGFGWQSYGFQEWLQSLNKQIVFIIIDIVQYVKICSYFSSFARLRIHWHSGTDSLSYASRGVELWNLQSVRYQTSVPHTSRAIVNVAFIQKVFVVLKSHQSHGKTKSNQAKSFTFIDSMIFERSARAYRAEKLE